MQMNETQCAQWRQGEEEKKKKEEDEQEKRRKAILVSLRGRVQRRRAALQNFWAPDNKDFTPLTAIVISCI